MTIRELLARGRLILENNDEGQLIARLLIQELLDCSEIHLIAHDDETVSPAQVNLYEHWLERALNGEPLPYIVGNAPFYDATFKVSPAVLIPRPETERLVELALNWAQENRPTHIFDVGTGSGCIPITLARHAPPANIWAIDISQAALKIAWQNIQKLTPNRPVGLVNGDLLAPFTPLLGHSGPWLVTANLPYITDLEWTELAVGVKSYEPALALKGGVDGFNLIKRLLAQVADVAEHTSYPGALFLEIGWQQGEAGLALLQQNLPGAASQLVQDYAGLDRFLVAMF